MVVDTQVNIRDNEIVPTPALRDNAFCGTLPIPDALQCADDHAVTLDQDRLHRSVPPPDISALLLSNSYHPDSATLTRRLADQLGLRAG
ncbi:hypothetical protein [Mycobacterium leprae]|uniref:hypothetical protein n=1 Tax=Mycobacterium leprae TaxID=1769 RepID=UPI0019550E41|nr:hypothetical protein [Mycobacterium leprae]